MKKLIISCCAECSKLYLANEAMYCIALNVELKRLDEIHPDCKLENAEEGKK